MARQSEAATVIYAIRTHGAARLQRLTPWRVSREDPDPPLVTSPAWSRDSRSIAFSRYFRGAPRIYVVGANGGHLRQVARGELPTWSPREGRLAFIASARKPNEIGTGIPIGIGLVKPGSRPRVIANSPGSEWIVTWTREGNELVFAAGNWIYIAQSGIPTRRPTATDRGLLRLVPTPDQSWSATGRLLVPRRAECPNRRRLPSSRPFRPPGAGRRERGRAGRAHRAAPPGVEVGRERILSTDRLA